MSELWKYYSSDLRPDSDLLSEKTVIDRASGVQYCNSGPGLVLMLFCPLSVVSGHPGGPGRWFSDITTLPVSVLGLC